MFSGFVLTAHRAVKFWPHSGHGSLGECIEEINVKNPL